MRLDAHQFNPGHHSTITTVCHDRGIKRESQGHERESRDKQGIREGRI